MKSFRTLIDYSTKAVIINDRRIKRVISQVVPAKTMAHIEFCRVEGGRMRITVDGAAWISRLRFMEKQIITMMREHKFDCHTISYHVSPETRPVVSKTMRRAVKTNNSAASMEAAANAVAVDSTEGDGGDKLRQELLKLARTLRGD